MRASTLVFVSIFFFGCGGRSLPTTGKTSDGGQIQEFQTLDITSKRDVAPRDTNPYDTTPWTPPDLSCTWPPTLGCASSDECPSGFYCGGCFPDPCCPECAVCFPKCIPGCLDNGDCEDEDFCVADSCAPSDGDAGICVPRPMDCISVYEPVCACDERTHPNACHAHGQGVNVAYQGECHDDRCRDVQCAVGDDCCACDAFPADNIPPSCPTLCEVSTCESWGFSKPSAYCLQGHCLITDTERGCIADNDCVLHDDCCRCAALHRSIKPPQCPAMCFVPSCTALGVATAEARCMAGVCKVAWE